MWEKENGTFDSGFIIFNVNDISYQIGIFILSDPIKSDATFLFKISIVIVEMNLKYEGQMCLILKH